MSADTGHILPANIFEQIFERSTGALLVRADAPRFTIVAASDAYLEVTSSKREDILGKGFSEVFPDNPDNNIAEDARAQHVFTEVTTTGKKIDIPGYRYDVRNAETGKYEECHWSCSNVPLPGNDGKIAYILNTIVDITEEVKAKEAAIESENTLRLATESTGLAMWDLNLVTHKFSYSPRLAEIFGYSPNAVLTLEQIRSHISAEEMENVVRSSFKRALISGTYVYEVKVNGQDGSQRWIKTQGSVLFEQKQPVRMLGTILDITESKRDEIRKNDFIAMASHELKTPLTSVKAYLQLLGKKLAKHDDPFVNTALIKAVNQVNKMSDLIYGFLDLSRLESGKLKLKVQQFEMNRLIEETIAETLAVSTSHSIIFKPQEAIRVTADREKISQVISNFLSNAIKYSPTESSITITSVVTSEDIQIAVCDEGIGIKPKEQLKLFQRFYRVENEKIKNISGFGIGLYLASEIIQRHKGKIWVASAEDKGSTFYFSLPLV